MEESATTGRHHVSVFESTMAQLGLTPRPQQAKLVKLARVALDAEPGNRVKFVQAGTGTGKSYALLTTALEAAQANHHPTVVVCPNNALIDQYVLKDAPRIAAVAGGKFAHIKGRSRYVCANARAFDRLPEVTARQEYRSLIAKGSLEWAELGLDHTYACPGSPDCDRASSSDSAFCPKHGPMYSNDPDAVCACEWVCGAFEAKHRARDADVIITNGHVLTWNYLVYQFTGGAASLLPDAGAVFVDECHELEDIGRDCVSDEIKPGSKVYEAVTGLREWVDNAVQRMVAVGQTEALLTRDTEIEQLAAQAKAEADDLLDQADGQGVDPALAKSYRREAQRLMRFVDFVSEDDDFISTIEIDHSNPYDDTAALLKRRCVNAAPMFSQILGRQPSLLVSGTIPNSAPRRLGFKATVEDVGHPFDYSKSTLAISPHSPKDRAAFLPRVEQVAQAINSTNGGTLVLFTSWSDVETIVPALAKRLNPDIVDRTYVQDRDDPTTLKGYIEAFKEDGNAVLIGVRSLFTGLDIPGDALRQVIIWKLPYPVPTLEWKAIEKTHGKQTYFDAMLTVLTQGIGRLVRTVEDSGRIFIVDERAGRQRWRASHMTAHIADFTPHRRPGR